LATNSYFQNPEGLTGKSGALSNVDYYVQSFQTNGTASDYYRLDNCGSQPATDYLRPKFLAAQTQFGDDEIGPFNLGWTSGGDWQNFTRNYPTNNYYVYARLAGGGGAYGVAQKDPTQLAIVTSGLGTPNQVSNILGTFSDPNANGWQSWHWIQLMSLDGSPAVVTLGGKATLKLMCGGNVNEQFMMFLPAPASSTIPQPTITAAVVSGQVNIGIPTVTGHTYTLLFTATLSPASWAPVGTPITGDGNTHVLGETPSGAAGFYKVQVQ
jgi:hypothetical protein